MSQHIHPPVERPAWSLYNEGRFKVAAKTALIQGFLVLTLRTDSAIIIKDCAVVARNDTGMSTFKTFITHPSCLLQKVKKVILP